MNPFVAGLAVVLVYLVVVALVAAFMPEPKEPKK